MTRPPRRSGLTGLVGPIAPVAVAGVAALVAGSACADVRASGDEPANAEGLRVYREQYCGTCHAFTVAGTGGIFGPPHDSMRAVAERRVRDPDYGGSATTVAAHVRESLTDPAAYVVPGFEGTRYLMPPYRNLSAAELDALVRLLLDATSMNGG